VLTPSRIVTKNAPAVQHCGSAITLTPPPANQTGRSLGGREELMRRVPRP